MSERLTAEREARILSELMPDNERAITDELQHLRAELAGVREDVDHWRVKAKCYGDIVHGCTPALEKAGFPVDSSPSNGGAVAGIAQAVERMAAELDAQHACLVEIADKLAAERETTEDLKLDLRLAMEGQRCECSSDDMCRFAKEREEARSALATERARPMPRVEWGDDDFDDYRDEDSLYPVGTDWSLGEVWVTVGAIFKSCWCNGPVITSATCAEARAALVAAAEAAGFDVSACRKEGEG